MSQVIAEFIAESPLATARRLADRDLKRAATAADLAWLHAHPLMWLRALQCISREIENHIAKDRAGVAHLKPGAGHSPTREWLAAKAEVDARTGRRLHYQQLVQRRAEEVKAILGPEPAAGYVSVGDLIALMTELSLMADEGDLAAAADKAMYWAKVWASKARRPAPAAVGDADPLRTAREEAADGR